MGLSETGNAQSTLDTTALRENITKWAAALGFQRLGVSDIDLSECEPRLEAWLQQGFHGDMGYMQRHGRKRTRPEQLVEGTHRIISVAMDYLPEDQARARRLLDHPHKSYVSRYALGRDYHKLMRRRLQKLADQIRAHIGEFGYRAFVDSAPVMEKPIAEKAGLGWIGKHTNLIDKTGGSWFFLGELYTDLPLPTDAKASNHCGSCSACIEVCPTRAIVAPYQLDARRCISYLTIELDDDIPVSLRKAIGNRIYGCDDCQLFCPWNKFAKPTAEADFAPRHALDDAQMATLASWDEALWLRSTEGSAIRRIGYRRWQRNLAVGLGNAASTEEVINALQNLHDGDDEQVARHARWGLDQHESRNAPKEKHRGLT